MKSSSSMAIIFFITSIFTAGCGQMLQKHKDRDSAHQPDTVGNDSSQSPAQTPVQSQTQTTPESPVQTPPPAGPVVVTSGGPSMPAGGNLFVVLGGNGSCNSLRESKIVPGLITTSLFNAFNDNVLTAGLVTPADDVFYACAEWHSPELKYLDLREQTPMISIHEIQLEAVVLSHVQNHKKVIFIGHSHGGWRAMKLAASPLFGAMHVPTILITIDPISLVTCYQVRDAGCKEFPRDLSPVEMDELHATTQWLNIWQRPGLILGSAPIPAAMLNVEVASSHMVIPTNSRVWAAITQFFAGRL